MAREKDLGFISGIKAQGLPLIAGLVSFTLLVERVMNEIESFFLVKENWGTYIFILLYFLAPVVLVLMWILWFNSNEGLKKYYRAKSHKNKKHPYPLLYWIIRLVPLSFLTLVGSFFFVTSFNYLGLSFVCLALILFYTLLIFLRNGKRQQPHEYKIEFRQAKIQFLLVVLLLAFLWVPYFYQQITVTSHEDNYQMPDGKGNGGESQQYTSVKQNDLTEFQRTWFAERHGGNLINCYIDTASVVRRRMKQYSDAVDKLSQQTPGFPEIDSSFYLSSLACFEKLKHEMDINPVVLKLATEHDTLSRRWLRAGDSVKAIEQRNRLKKAKEPRRSVDSWNAEKASLMYFDCRAINTHLQYVKYLYSDNYKTRSAMWLQIVQFKGLLVFIMMALFLTCVWYDAYSLNLMQQGGEEFSEVNSARISIYLLFLLTIPFFKPIEAKNIELDKPYVSLSDELSLSSRYGSVQAPASPVDPAVLNHIRATADSILSYQAKELKKERRKPIVAYQ